MRFDGETLMGATATNPGGNSPAGEPPANAVDGVLTSKWLDFNKAPLVLDFGAPVEADGYRFGTANDEPARDPISWTLEGSDDNETWTLIDEQIDNPTTTLRQVYDYEFLFSDPPRIFQFERFDQIVLAGDSGEIDYDVEGATSLTVDNGYGAVDPLDFGFIEVTPPSNVDTVYTLTASDETTSSTASTVIRSVTQTEQTFQYVRFTPLRLREELPGQPGANSIQLAEFEFSHAGALVTPVGATNPDGDFNEGQEPSTLIDGDFTNKWLDFNKSAVVFDFGSPTTFDGYFLTTGDDGPERDPIAWLLEGSDDQTDWTVIDAIVGLSFDPTMPFNYLLPDDRLATSEEIPLPSNIAGGPASISSFNSNPIIVADGEDVNLSWASALATSLEIDNSVGPVSGASGTVAVAPPTNADTTYTFTVDNAFGMPASDSTFVRSVTPGSANYQYVRFVPLRLGEDLPEDEDSAGAQLAEFAFYNGETALDLNALGTEVTGPLGNSPANEGPAMLIDGDVATKWLDFNKSAVVFDFQSPQTFDGYQWTTGNDAPNRDPIAWRLDGSMDGENWTAIDLVDKNRSDETVELGLFAGLPRGATIQVIPLPEISTLPNVAPIIEDFDSDAPTVVNGEPAVLRWRSSFGASATIDDGSGPVSVPTTGTLSVSPTTDSTYTLTVTGDNGTATAEYDVAVVNPTITEICYENFDSAGEELSLLGSAEIVNDFETLANPGDFNRLRLTPIEGSQGGSAWFRSRVGTSIGFDTTFDLHFPSGGNGGADGAVFIVQNHPDGNVAAPNNEAGLGTDALNITFDSYLNGDEASAAMVRVSANGEVLADVDLTSIPELGIAGDLTQTNDSTPYTIQVGYTSSGLLSVLVNQVLVVSELSVDLDAIGAVDENGEAYVGFSARTGGLFEAHDVTSWCYTEGEPVLLGSVRLVDYSFDFSAGSETVSLTWTSNPGATYRIVAAGSDLTDFSEVLGSGIPSAGATTSQTVSLNPDPLVGKKFIRVEEE
jgi:hypothetical protein